jgi:hypothetical protein
MTHELSSPAQQLFSAYYWERRYFKRIWTFLMKTGSRALDCIRKLDLLFIWELSLALEGCSTLHQQLTKRKIRD